MAEELENALNEQNGEWQVRLSEEKENAEQLARDMRSQIQNLEKLGL